MTPQDEASDPIAGGWDGGAPLAQRRLAVDGIVAVVRLFVRVKWAWAAAGQIENNGGSNWGLALHARIRGDEGSQKGTRGTRDQTRGHSFAAIRLRTGPGRPPSTVDETM
jgi:hypothetical protein